VILRKTVGLALAAFLAALLLPLGSASVATLPACCRRGGKHHCAMLAAETADTSGFSLRELCPHHRLPVPVTASTAHATPIWKAGLQIVAVHTLPAARVYSEAQPSSAHTRGPPFLVNA